MSTHETSSTAADSEPWMCGSATFVTVTSSTCMTVTSITAPVIVHFRVAVSGSSLAGAVVEPRRRRPGAVRSTRASIGHAQLGGSTV